jgi:hypothetical protein
MNAILARLFSCLPAWLRRARDGRLLVLIIDPKGELKSRDEGQGSWLDQERKFFTGTKLQGIKLLDVIDIKDASEIPTKIAEHRPGIVHVIGTADPTNHIHVEREGEGWGVKSFADVFRYKECWLVVLNVCHSSAFAKEIAKEIEFAIGMDMKIFDEQAVSFSKTFYTNLGVGLDVRGAFPKAVRRVAEEESRKGRFPATPLLFAPEVREFGAVFALLCLAPVLVVLGVIWLLWPAEPDAEVVRADVSIGWLDAFRACPFGAKASFSAVAEGNPTILTSSDGRTLNLNPKEKGKHTLAFACGGRVFHGQVEVSFETRTSVPLR